jgi:MbtH protein
MMGDEMATEEGGRDFIVVVNDEEQYSIWPALKPIPKGWREEGFRGPKDACLEHIEAAWTDMRPLSLRRAMDNAADD